MSGTTTSNSWDDVWAEFDARQPVPAVRAPARSRPASVWAAPSFKRLIVLMGCALVVLYLASPIAFALQVASAIQRGDAEALSSQMDWASLRPALEAALVAGAQANHARPMPDFITGMARDMTDRLASPSGLAALLNERLASPGQPAREMLDRIRVIEAGLWEITLISPWAPYRSAKLTLALVDPLRLRWEVRAITLPSRAR
ncbi:MAG: hypothetical protein JWR10_1079 [Rubritepida sp.]|nr:hypothetical protein [Rubritepida sp.]